MFDRFLIFLYFQCSFFHVPDGPIYDCIHIYRNRIFGQSLFGLERTYPYTLVDISRHTVYNRDNHKGAWAFQAAVFPHTQDYRPFPLVGNTDCRSRQPGKKEQKDEYRYVYNLRNIQNG